MRQHQAKAKNALAMVVLAFCLLSVGCAKKSENAAPSAPNFGSGHQPPVGPGGSPGSDFGGTAAISLIGGTESEKLSNLEQFTNLRAFNPKNINLSLNMVKSGEATSTTPATWGGTLLFSLVDYLQATGREERIEAYFTAGNSAKDTQYNQWRSMNGAMVFRGTFEDLLHASPRDLKGGGGGGAVIVIDQVVNLGDGQGPEDLVGGSIWYKNFAYVSYAPHPPTYCWFVSLGPYDCRPWPSGSGMNIMASVNPQGGYKLLGRFQGLSLKKAFNGEKVF